MKKSTVSLEIPVGRSMQHFPMLSRTKLAAPDDTSLALSRKVEIKSITKFFEQLKPWQQKLMVSLLIKRCSGTELEQLNSILKVLIHRDFQASFNKKYPPKGFRSRIDHKKAAAAINKLFDNIFTLKVNWRQAVRYRHSALRELYLQERWRPSTPMYYSADVTQFSLHIQQAVARIMGEQNLPVTPSPEAVADGAIVAKPPLLDLVITPASRSPSKMAIKFSRPSSLYRPNTQYANNTGLADAIIQERAEVDRSADLNHSRPVSQLTLPTSQSAVQRYEGTTPTATRSTTRQPKANTSVGARELSADVRQLAIVPPQGEVTPLSRPPVASVSLPLLTPDYRTHSLRYSSALETGSSSTPGSTSVENPHQPSADSHHIDRPAALHTAEPQQIAEGVEVNQPMGVAVTTKQPIASHHASAISDERKPADGVNKVSGVIAAATGAKGQSAGVGVEPASTLAAASAKISAILTGGPVNRNESFHPLDYCESSFVHFDYGEPQAVASVSSEVIDVQELGVYQPTDAERTEDNEMIVEFTDRVSETLQRSREHISSEDELADVIAECILSSAVGLALISADSKVKLSRTRFLNLRDRLSSEAMQATIKVFYINPPVKKESSLGSNTAADAQYVDPFTLQPEQALQMVALPQTYFKKVRLGQSHKPSSALRKRQRLSRHGKLAVSSKGKVKEKKNPAVYTDKSCLYDEESKIPQLESMTLADFCASKSKCMSSNQLPCYQSADVLRSSHLQAEFIHQLNSIQEMLSSWQASDIVKLLHTLIGLACEQSTTVLPLIAREIKGRVVRVTNITELPDRLLVMIFQYMDVDSLQVCQEVCRRWSFLCSRPELWISKCNQLGNTYGIRGLCRSICDHIDSVHTVDWQLAYRELSVSLCRYGNPIKVQLHPATLASKGYSSQVNIAGWNQSTSPAPASPTNEKDISTSLSKPKSTLLVSDFTLSDNIYSDDDLSSLLDKKTDSPTPPSQAQARTATQFVKKSRFPRLKFKNNVLVSATDSVAQVTDSVEESKDPPANLSEERGNQQWHAFSAVKQCNSSDTIGSSLLANVDRSVSLRPVKKDADVKHETIYEKVKKADEHLEELALDMRTNLQPSKLLNHLNLSRLKADYTNQSQRKLSYQSRTEHGKFDFRRNSSPLLTTDKMNPSMFAEKDGRDQLLKPSMMWLSADEYNPRDQNITRRFMGYVKPVSCVHKFKGQPDVIYCCDFDKNRVFTAGMDGIIYLWDKRTGRKVEELTGHNGSVRSLVLDSVKDLLYSASWDTAIIVWDVVRLRKKTSFLGHDAAVVDIKLNRKRAILCSACSDGTVKVWCTRIYRCMQTLHSHSANVNCIFYDGVVLASAAADGNIVVYSSSSYAYYTHMSTCVAEKTLKDVSSVGNIVASSGQLWDKSAKDKYMINSITSVLVVNELVLGGTNHGELCCWSRNTGHIVARFDVHIGAVTSINLWCQRILTSGSDGVMKEWELATMTCVRRLHDHSNSINCTKVNETNETIVSVGEDKLIHVWYFEAKKKPTKAASIKSRSLPSYAIEKTDDQ